MHSTFTRYKLAAQDLSQLAAISPALISHFLVRVVKVLKFPLSVGFGRFFGEKSWFWFRFF